MRIASLDIGTHSLGICVRDINQGENLKDQLVYYSVDSFNSGIGTSDKGEYSYAAERSKARRQRVLFNRRRYRNWATLRLLIEHQMCPLTLNELEQWTTYDKKRNLYRRYPIDAVKFEQWIRLDFDGDGKPDYTSPYQLRKELATCQLDFTNEIDRFKLGRALYHISQRRGFKSSKGETLKEMEKNNEEELSSDTMLSQLKESEEKKSSKIKEIMLQHNLPTIGCAFAKLEDEGIRIRGSEYVAVRTQYHNEIVHIFKYQEGLKNEQELLIRLLSTKKGVGTIFYKCPLKSQKGSVGKCTLEPKKTRCPQSHPRFEEFRAWTLINNIKYRKDPSYAWTGLSLDEKRALYNDLFTKYVRKDFKFKVIREWINKRVGSELTYNGNEGTINYDDQVVVPGCPIIGRLINLLGDDWESFKQEGNKERYKHSKTSLEKHKTSYDAFDIWHVCYSLDDEEDIIEFAKNRLNWDTNKQKQLVQLWGEMREGYGMLSLKALNNINRFLKLGLIYSDAVLLAKLPDLIKDWNLREAELMPQVISALNEAKELHKVQKTTSDIVNKLIGNYKSLGYHTNKFAQSDYEYNLDQSDHKDILEAITAKLGSRSWSLMDASEQTDILDRVTTRYQEFFRDSKRAYAQTPHLVEILADRLNSILQTKIPGKALYHHSNISPYATQIADDNTRVLGTPNIGSIKNPVALRTLHIIRRKINDLILKGIIKPDETRIVIETTRDFNDANMRAAIRTFNTNHENEHREIRCILEELNNGRDISEEDINKAMFFFEQTDNYDSIYDLQKKTGESAKKIEHTLKDITKYKLWKEQKCTCIYTGRTISLSDLFSENVDIEHTTPRSISYDNSLANKTVCDAYYNRMIKKNRIPSELENFEKEYTFNNDKTYTAIRPRLEAWEKIVERLERNISACSARVKKAIDKDHKDLYIRQRHVLQMELDYWKTKLQHFTRTEVKDGFRNRQLVDTGIITRHTAIYMKSLFKHVDVQKGTVTAQFRKIFGIQEKNEEKDRDNLAHHAIDALVLTLIPVPEKRERMIKLFYEKEEAIDENRQEKKTNLLNQEIKDCNLGNNVIDAVNHIKSHILVNHLSSDKALVPARKVVRHRGKEVLYRQKDGSVHHHIATGDSIRGSLHKESFYGAIKYPMTDQNGMPIKKDGKYVYDEKDNDILIVMRVSINKFKTTKDCEAIIDPIVKNSIIKTIEQRSANKIPLSKPMWLLDKDGNEVRFDKNGHPLAPIRHVRCKVKAGKGYFRYETSLPIRTQTHHSQKPLKHLKDREHKQKLYAQSGEKNYLYLLYCGVKKEQINYKSRIINYFEVAQLRKEKLSDGTYRIKSTKDLLQEPYYKSFEEKKVIYHINAVVKVGTRVLKWEKSPEELSGLDIDKLLERLYVVKKFNSTSSNHLYLKRHTDGSNENNFSEVADSNIKYYLIEGRDFEIDSLGNIHFFD